MGKLLDDKLSVNVCFIVEPNVLYILCLVLHLVVEQENQIKQWNVTL